MNTPRLRHALASACALLAATTAFASSHREAPSITTTPKADASDFYMFNSYEGVAADGSGGRAGFVTLIANYEPLQDPAGGPNFFSLDPNAVYEIHVDNDGDAIENLTFQFAFTNTLKSSPNGITLPIGNKSMSIPLIQAGAVSNVKDANLNVNESFTINLITGDRRSGRIQAISNATGGATVFDKPADNIGIKTIADYPTYAAKHIYTINIPGCATPGRVFVGQRKDPFAANLGVIFDLVNANLTTITNPAAVNAGTDALANKNVTSIALEVPAACLKGATDSVIGGWTTASLRQGSLLNATPKKGLQTTAIMGGALTQVSRLGNPLTNEVVIGLPDKDRFNGSKPKDDAQFLDYVQNPTLPALLEAVFPNTKIAPTNALRNDLVTVFLTGIKGVNQMSRVTPSEMLRLNMAIPAVPFASQNRLGVVGNILAKGNDNAGFPNGRRPKDDVIDIALIAMTGGLCMANGTTDALGFGAACNPSAVPLGATSFQLHDAVDQAARTFLPAFPYLNTPLSGQPTTP